MQTRVSGYEDENLLLSDIRKACVLHVMMFVLYLYMLMTCLSCVLFPDMINRSSSYTNIVQTSSHVVRIQEHRSYGFFLNPIL